MKPPASLHFKTYVSILLMIIFAPVGNVLLRKGMENVGAVTSWEPAVLLHFFWRAFTSATIWLGIGSLLAFFVAYMLVLSWADFSYIQSACSISYAVVALFGWFLLREPVEPIQWIGVGIICLGVLIVGNTSPRTTKRS